MNFPVDQGIYAATPTILYQAYCRLVWAPTPGCRYLDFDVASARELAIVLGVILLSGDDDVSP
jgi:hypothetical protein